MCMYRYDGCELYVHKALVRFLRVFSFLLDDFFFFFFFYVK